MSESIRALEESAAWLDALPVQLIHGHGADRVGFLHRLLSGKIEGVPEGHGSHALLLDTKGHVQSDLEVYVAADHLRLVVALGQGEATVASLARYAIMDDFEPKLAPDLGALAVLGPGAAAALRAAEVALPAALVAGPVRSHAALEDGGLWAIRRPRLGAAGFELWANAARLERLREALRAAGTPELPGEAAEALRVAAGEARFGIEITPERFPMEIGLDDAIDYKKGCYLGQEPIVRIRDRGHVNWALRRLRFDPGGPAPAPGDKLTSEARPAAGHVTSVARLPGPPAQGVALALVHQAAAGGPVQVLTAQGPVAVEVLELKSASALDRGGLD